MDAILLAVGTFLLLLLRGVLLWIVMPLTIVSWLLLLPLRIIRTSQGHVAFPSLGAYLAWSDALLVAALTRTVLRPFLDIEPRPDFPRSREEPYEGLRPEDLA